TYLTGITQPTDFRLAVTCINGGATDYSNTISVDLDEFYNCYCSPKTGTTLHSSTLNYITQVEILGSSLNNTTANGAVGAGGYTHYMPSTPNYTTDLIQNLSYTIQVTNPYTGYYNGVWIDWDQSGTFDAGEFVSL